MEITHGSRLPDGRMVLLANSLSRCRVLEQTQDQPFQAATVQLLPDAEEVAAAAASFSEEAPREALWEALWGRRPGQRPPPWRARGGAEESSLGVYRDDERAAGAEPRRLQRVGAVVRARDTGQAAGLLAAAAADESASRWAADGEGGGPRDRCCHRHHCDNDNDNDNDCYRSTSSTSTSTSTSTRRRRRRRRRRRSNSVIWRN